MEDLANFGRTADGEQHTGFHETMWERIAADTDTVRKIWQKVDEKLAWVSKKETEVFVVFVCKWGKHRSVGMAEIARHIFRRNGFDTTMAEHLSKKYWSKWKCGVKRCWCEAMTQKKTEALEAVPGVFEEVFL